MTNHEYQARVAWRRDDANFTDNLYSRGHEWAFDGGITVPASASPQVVPTPLSVLNAVDPEEALVAAAASCHMLCFLSVAAKQGFVVDSYEDEAVGEMSRNAEGHLAITRITLHPHVVFCEETPAEGADLESLHRAAHEACFIAHSLKSEIVVRTR